MTLERFAKRFAMIPALLLGLALFVPMSGAAEDDWWSDDDGGYYEEEGYGWGEGYGEGEYGEAGLTGEDQWWEDDDYGDYDYASDDYGYYDTDYDWETDEEWFGDWW